jgi:peptide-methionine (S)-S-oxide reductase
VNHNDGLKGLTMKQETAILAGGCFWGMQDLIRKMPGVLSTRVGYSGGDVPNATYRNHGTHAEAIEIVFDPDQISYRRLLEFFFQIHDPSTANRQGNDIGASYRSAIFTTNDAQKAVALDTIQDVDASGLWPGKVVTEVKPAGPFGKRNRNTRITWSSIRMAIPATSFARTGACLTAMSAPPEPSGA